MTIFGEMLRLWLAARGLSLRDVERQTGISRSTLSRILRGVPMRMETWLVLQQWMLTRKRTDVRAARTTP